ncbi:sensor histidine kinase [Paenibacillus harenae]|uniref:histidine kinase n=1 Tax=Paenibacillus harenae TaxID=306543 RepID=A0ABT9U9X2_PAEHA|nr:sensor histidine kinase [Paenibacillus harenae]MDQ0063437.1 two-component system sensor histidine kinase DesK [Paenibacillus harenae]MDQ0115808.1 two-component system sensor histidine kinase DesK [Paenibacillus harenae]
MQNWYQIFHKSTGLSPYVWVVLCILPFYFIFRSSTTYEIVYGILMIVLFFVCYVLSFVSKGWKLYFWTSMQIVISIAMTLLFSYVYFSIFLALFIGNVQNRIGFFTLYTVHLITTFITINYGFVSSNPLFVSQFPFVLICLIVVILLPVNTYNRVKQGRLQGQLEDANKRISDLITMQERQRIARDLHDTLGQKLSLIGLKSDLAGKLITKNPAKAQAEINDVRQTARTALKEVRELVTQMRGTRVEDEMFRVMQILKAAEIEFRLEGEVKLSDASLLIENVLSMCLKEAVTNVVKHSRASECLVAIEPRRGELVIRVQDNGVGIANPAGAMRGNGLQGMKERLEFVNGSLEIQSVDGEVEGAGTTLLMRVPIPIIQPAKEAEA